MWSKPGTGSTFTLFVPGHQEADVDDELLVDGDAPARTVTPEPTAAPDKTESTDHATRPRAATNLEANR